MKNSTIAGVLFLGIIIAILLTCKHDPDEVFINDEPVIADTSGNPGIDTSGNVIDTLGGISNPCDPDSVYFEAQVLPLLTSHCVKCHGGEKTEEEVNLSSYAQVIATTEMRPGNPGESKLYQVLVNVGEESMPPPPEPPLGPDQIQVIYDWIAQGAKDLTCQESGCDTVNPSFSNLVQPIIRLYCAGCHSGPMPSGNVALESYSDILAVAMNGYLLGVIEHKQGYVPMPQGGSKLPDCRINQIKAWINAGSQDN